MKRFILISYFFCLIILDISCSSRVSQGHNNIIYISLEDAMPSLGCYRDSIAYTPNIDSFASEALLFEDVHCQVALCTPSRTSILTGLRPSTTGLVKIDDDWQAHLPKVVSLPKHFRNNGYYTSLVGKIHDTRCGGMDSAYLKVFEEHGIKSNDLALEALKDACSQKKPFFLAIGYAQAHDPWRPSESFKKYYSLEDFSVQGRTGYYKDSLYDQNGIKELQRNYYGEITEVDSLIGEVIDKIKEKGLYENSIILVGAMDHGYNLGYRDGWGKGNNFDNETQVPLLIRVPKNPNNGKRSSGLVELVDLYPTLVDLCNLPKPPQELEGSSLRHLLDNPNRAWKKAVFTHRGYAVDIIGVKTKKYNLIDYAGDSVQLFDRKKDTINLNNIAEKYPEIVEELRNIKKGTWRSVATE